MASSISCATFWHDFLDARRMDAAIEQEALHGFAGDLAAHRIKAGKHHGIGRIVDEHGDARGGLEGADVATFAADDAAFQFLIRVARWWNW